MADESNPSKPGTSTSEFKLTVIAACAGIVITGLSGMFTQLHAQLPGVAWIAGAAGVLGGIVTIVLPILNYISGRSDVKVAALKADTAESIATTATANALKAVIPTPK